MKLPKIVAVGSPSSGKSSLIQQILGLDFLPCGPVINLFLCVGRCNKKTFVNKFDISKRFKRTICTFCINSIKNNQFYQS